MSMNLRKCDYFRRTVNPVLLHCGNLFQCKTERIDHEKYFCRNESVLLGELDGGNK